MMMAKVAKALALSAALINLCSGQESSHFPSLRVAKEESSIIRHANQKKHWHVYNGESIQKAVDSASPGDVVIVHAGTYKSDDLESRYGIRISQSSLVLRAKGKVRLVYNGGKQETGIYAGPPGCEFDDGECSLPSIKDITIKGFTVKGFPKNGIQTRWVDGFKMIKCSSINNLNNGLYATRSSNGLIKNSYSTGSLDTAGWTSACTNVLVVNNEFTNAPIGFEITVSKDIIVKGNKMHHNTLGVGLFHEDASGNPPMDDMSNWVIEQNKIYENNLVNPAPNGTFQADLLPGFGVDVFGVSDHIVRKNHIQDNKSGGIVMLGWCAARSLSNIEPLCAPGEVRPRPDADRNLVEKNKLVNNGKEFPPDIAAFLGIDDDVDILCAGIPFFESGADNCFRDNYDPDKLSTFAFAINSPTDVQRVDLPTGGCDVLRQI